MRPRRLLRLAWPAVLPGNGSRRYAVALAAVAALVPILVGSPLAAAADWPTYHLDQGRSGNDAGEPPLGAAGRGWSVALDGKVFAEPVTLGSIVVAATENDTLYGFDILTGRQLWATHAGTPLTNVAAVAGCGDIDPLGITSTPVIDASTRTVYAVAEEAAAPVRHELVGVNIDTGAVTVRTPLDPPLHDPKVQQQRGAIGLSQGRVYVPFGGLAGDCGDYHGYVVAAPANGSPSLLSYEVAPAVTGGGIWAPSGPSFDGAGNVFVSTGNSSANTPGSTPDDSESVVKLSPTLAKVDKFTTSTWIADNATDSDLGSTGPEQLAGGLVFAVGKNGNAYILNGSALGGIGGEAYSHSLCAAYGGDAYDGSTVYVPCTDGVTAVHIDPGPSFHQVWKSPSATKPPILAGGLVWSIGGSTLFGLNPANGAVQAQLPLSAQPMSFVTPTAAQGHLLVGAGTHIDSFTVPTGTMAVQGTDSQLYARHAATGWLPLGGVLGGAPAAVGIPYGNGLSDLYIVVGSDGALWERTDGAGWQHVSPAFTSCIDNPAATLAGLTLVVVCQGADHGVWVGQTVIDPRSPSLPTVPGFVSLGGSTHAGPAVAVVGGAAMYFAVGDNGALYQRTQSAGWGAFVGTACSGHPAAGYAGSVAFVACHGGGAALWYAVSVGGGFSGFVSAGGTLIDGPGVAAYTDHAAFTVEGLGGTVYQNVVSGGAQSGWQAENGLGQHGAGATST